MTKPNEIVERPKGFDFKSLLPYLIAVGVFFIVTLIFFKPMIIDNKIMNQSDIVHYKGISKETQDYRAKYGKEPLWTNSLFSGMPAFQVSTLYNGNLTHYVHSILQLGLPHPSGLLFLAFISCFILFIVLGINPILSITGALAFGLCSYNLVILEAGHNTKMAAMAYMPMVTAGLILLFNKKYLWGFILFSLSLALEIKANHLQITYYLAICLFIYGLVEAIQTIRNRETIHLMKVAGLVIASALVGVASNTSLLWSTASYMNHSIRGKSELSSNTQSSGGLDKDYAFSWSYGKMETFTLLIPDFYGGSSNHALSEKSAVAKAFNDRGIAGQQATEYLSQMPIYWGDKPFTSGPVYLGAVVCLFFLLGMFIIKDRIRWWLLGATMFTIFLAWGRNLMWFNDLFFYYLPGYNKFRTVEMILVIPQLTFAITAVLALHQIWLGKISKDELLKYLKISAGIAGGLCLFFATLGSGFFDFNGQSDGSYPDWLISALKDDRKSLLQSDSFRSLIFILLSAVAVWLMLKDKINKNVFAILIGLLMVIDLVPVSFRYFGDKNFVPKSTYDAVFQPTQADLMIKQDPNISYRVLNLAGNTFNDSRTSYHHKSIGGYSAVKMRRYQELIENQISKNNPDVIDMLNSKYLLVSGGEDKEPIAQPNPSACGNAWFVDSLLFAENADEEMNRIGPMYSIKTLNNSSLSVNGKKITEAQVGNHDNILVDTFKIDISSARLLLGQSDTFGLDQKTSRNGSNETKLLSKKEGAESLFTMERNYRFNPRRYAVIDKRYAEYVNALKLQPDSGAKIQLITAEPNHLVYTTERINEGFAVMSEIYYPDGWNISIDGKSAECIRVNYVLRGMRIPAGKHKIEFTFEPDSFIVGEKISMAASGLLLLLLLGISIKDLFMKRKPD
ncbi:hypothetical protein LBMAG25_13370 [Bacteroidota bacterium]|nr:hypothetical protein LBMAG25_13370 [Bacteroidota bacterium]